MCERFDAVLKSIWCKYTGRSRLLQHICNEENYKSHMKYQRKTATVLTLLNDLPQRQNGNYWPLKTHGRRRV